MGRGDTATGGAGDDTFEMDTRWTDGTGQFVVDDFVRGEDRLELTYTAQYDATGAEIKPAVTFAPAAGGESSVILINGTPIATISGVKDMALSDLLLVPAVITDSTYDPDNFDTEVMGTSAGQTTTASGSTALFAQGGNDIFTGSGADDYADMGTGNDRADMGEGDDSAFGGEGADTLLGGAGSDTLRSGNGMDSLSGGDGDDFIGGGAGNDVASGGAGNDSMDGGADHDNLSGDAGNDTVLGGGGNDTLAGGSGDDGMDGGIGNDQLTAGAGNDAVYGGDGDDIMAGGSGADTLTGGLGNDTMSGFDTDDAADTASDLMYGGAGVDQIWAAAGDKVYGGGDSDTFHIADTAPGGVPRIEDFEAGEKIEVHYPTGTAAPVITLAPSSVAGEMNILADGVVVAQVVATSATLTLASITVKLEAA
jgi:Ca2+-binding RTX toxin-like protein